MAIGGKIKEGGEPGDNTKHVGLFEAEVIAINPTRDEYKSLLGIDLAEDSNADEYIGKNKDGNNFIRIDFWLKNIHKELMRPVKVSYFIENKIRENKDGTKKQYINNIGNCSWGESESDLKEWFTKREFREAYSGEEEFYTLMRSWLAKLDYRDTDTEISIDIKKLLKNQLKDIKEQIGGDYATSFIVMATVISKESEDGVNIYQGIYNKAFMPSYLMKNFVTVDYTKSKISDLLFKKLPKDLKLHEKFIVNIKGEYGCKNYFLLKPLQEYSEEEDVTTSDKTLSSDDEDEDEDY